MQIVHILRAEKKAIAELRLKLRQRNVRRIRLRLRALLAPLRVELPHQRRIQLQRLGRAHILNAMPRPQSVRGAKRRQPALRADPRAGQHKHPIRGRDCNLRPIATPWL